LNGHKPGDLYQLVIGEVEKPLLRAVLTYTHGNQSEAAEISRHQPRHAAKEAQSYKLRADEPARQNRRATPRRRATDRETAPPRRRALLSVADKQGLEPLAQGLAALGYEIVSTGGTAKALRKAGVGVTEVATITGFPEIMDGRVKTLHPHIHVACSRAAASMTRCSRSTASASSICSS